MNVRRNLLLGFFLFSVVAAGLFYLPTSVVNNKPAEVSTESLAEKTTKSSPITDNQSLHPVDAELEKALAEFRGSLIKETKKVEQARICTEMAKTFVRANRFDSAGTYYESAMKFNPDLRLEFEAGSAWFESLAFTSSASLLEASAEKARSLLSVVPNRDPRYAEAQARSAITWVNSPSPMKGILKLRELAEAYPENSYIAYQLGMLSFQSGQYEKAVERFRKVLSLEKENTNAWFYLSSSLLQSGKKAEATEAAKTGLKLAKEDDSRASFEELLHQLEK